MTRLILNKPRKYVGYHLPQLASINLPPVAKKEGNSIPVNIKKCEDKFQLILALPGFDKQNIQISISDNRLNVSAFKETYALSENHSLNKKDMVKSREFVLPAFVDNEGINAESEDGLLIVNIPFTAKHSTKNISIQ